jgi:hypothetical protein
MERNKKAQDLLRLLGQRTPSATPAVAKTATPPPPTRTNERHEPRTPGPARPAPKGRRGKAVQFWLHEEDEKLIRELKVWLTPHRKMISDSLVVKAVLRAAKTGKELLAAYDDALTTDSRFKTHPKGRK